ncbi:tryptophan--tRNA ligase [Amycolatopsis sp. NPDC050768]|uniref:tryptophan--tRNA ligase n=1 Tax=Amycolatopsis sp. NPDC050768 TaxID=3154839 RepID=UPI00340F2356
MAEVDPAVARSDELEAEILAAPSDFRVLTGDRPTGPLHLGHYFGTLQNRVRLQNLGVDTILVIADYQVLTDRDVADDLPGHVRELVLDYLAVGIDPARSTVFTHSSLPALNQLLLPFLSLVTVPELQRNATVKDEIAHSHQGSVSGLMFTYPVHQAADILFCKANLVPVGRDQLPHLELTRTVARRFNDRYGRVFPEPEALLSAAPSLLGTDGRKMSKSRGNAIALRASADETARLLKGAKTDSERVITYEPQRRPEVSSLVLLAALCRGVDPREIAREAGAGGGGTLKRIVTDAVNDHFAPIRRRRAEFAGDPALVSELLRDGNLRAGATAEATLAEVREAMSTVY